MRTSYRGASVSVHLSGGPDVKLTVCFWKFMCLWRGADIRNKKSHDGKPRDVFFSWAAAAGLRRLNSTLAFENNSTLPIFYLIYSAQTFPHQAGVLILSQNKSVSPFSDTSSPHRQQKEKLQNTATGLHHSQTMSIFTPAQVFLTSRNFQNRRNP